MTLSAFRKWLRAEMQSLRSSFEGSRSRNEEEGGRRSGPACAGTDGIVMTELGQGSMDRFADVWLGVATGRGGTGIEDEMEIRW